MPSWRAILTAGAAAAAAATHVLGLSGLAVRVVAIILSAVLDSLLFLAAFRLATAKVIATRDMVRGALLSAIAWQILLVAAGLIISHYLRHAQAIAGLFGIVLGLLAWFALQATVTVYAIEADVVRARGLWPRSITQPPLTGGDMRYLAGVVAVETRRPEQHVATTFSAAASPGTGRSDGAAPAERDR